MSFENNFFTTRSVHGSLNDLLLPHLPNTGVRFTGHGLNEVSDDVSVLIQNFINAWENHEMVSVVGANGYVGLACARELMGYVPATPEEAVAYTLSVMRRGMQERRVNVYDFNGVTVIDYFIITPGSVESIE